MAKKPAPQKKKVRQMSPALKAKVAAAKKKMAAMDRICERLGAALGVSGRDYGLGIMLGTYPRIDPAELEAEMQKS